MNPEIKTYIETIKEDLEAKKKLSNGLLRLDNVEEWLDNILKINERVE